MFIVDHKVKTTGFSRSALAAKICCARGGAAWTTDMAAIRLAKRGELFQYRIKQFADYTGRGNAKLNPSFVALDRVFQGGRLQNFPFMNGEDCFDGFAPSADAFFFYFGDLIAERFMAALDVVHDWPQGGIPVADLRKRIAEIDHELDTLLTRRDELASQLLSVGIAG